MKRLVIDLNPTAYEMLEQARSAIVRRNIDRTKKGEFNEQERATFKSIVERGIAAVHRELVDAI